VSETIRDIECLPEDSEKVVERSFLKSDPGCLFNFGDEFRGSFFSSPKLILIWKAVDLFLDTLKGLKRRLILR
jgi:hypothetical protein